MIKIIFNRLGLREIDYMFAKFLLLWLFSYENQKFESVREKENKKIILEIKPVMRGYIIRGIHYSGKSGKIFCIDSDNTNLASI